jgi:hypothetical protein
MEAGMTGARHVRSSPTGARSGAITSAGGCSRHIRGAISSSLQVGADRLSAIASVPWSRIEPALDSNLAAPVQTWVNGSRRIWDMGIHGEGQVISSSDSGIRTSHNMFKDVAVPITTFGDFPTHRKIIAYKKISLNIAGDDAPTRITAPHRHDLRRRAVRRSR